MDGGLAIVRSKEDSMLFGGTLIEKASHDILTARVVDWEVSEGKDGIMVGTLRLMNCGSR